MRQMSKKKILIVCLLILLVTVAVVSLIFSTEPTAKSEGATKKTAMLVSVKKVEREDHQPVFVVTGNVRPVEDVQLNPLVNGPIVRRSPNFIPGGIVWKGETLLEINPQDFKNALELRKSELQQAQTDLAVEKGRQEIAQQDLALVGGDSLSMQQKKLVLRQPQLSAVKANVRSARAAVEQAKLNLDRTKVKAPFDAQVISQNVTVGAQVDNTTNLGRLVGIYEYWVEINMPIRQLKWLSFADRDKKNPTDVTLYNKSSWGRSAYRKGHLYTQIGALDQQTRLARLLVKVKDPLGLNTEKTKLPQLIIGSFVEAHVKASKIENVIKIDRDFLRSENTVWVMKDGELSIRKPEIVLMDQKFAYIKKGIADGEKIVTSNISTVTDGVALRTSGQQSARSKGND